MSRFELASPEKTTRIMETKWQYCFNCQKDRQRNL